MIAITLPDGSVHEFDSPVSGSELAASIGPGLAKAALALNVDGEVKDLAHIIDADATVSIVTRDSGEALELLRHDAAHVMAEAVQELYPGVQVTFGPAIEDGFFYDFYREEPFTPDDLVKIEKRMREIVARDETITREVWDRDEAIRFFKDKGEIFKAEHIETLPHDADISIYRQGEWLDLCTGPHLPSTAKLGKHTVRRPAAVLGAFTRMLPLTCSSERSIRTVAASRSISDQRIAAISLRRAPVPIAKAKTG